MQKVRIAALGALSAASLAFMSSNASSAPAFQVGDQVTATPGGSFPRMPCRITEVQPLYGGGAAGYRADCRTADGRTVNMEVPPYLVEAAPGGATGGAPTNTQGSPPHTVSEPAPDDVLHGAPRQAIVCDPLPKGGPGAPDPRLIRRLIQCQYERMSSDLRTVLMTITSIRAEGARGYRSGGAYEGMPLGPGGGVGGDAGIPGAGPGTTIYPFDVSFTVDSYASSGRIHQEMEQVFNCYYARGGYWTCGGARIVRDSGPR